MSGDARLAAIFDAAARGEFPLFDGAIETVPRTTGAAGAVIAFTGHHVVAANVTPAWVATHCPSDDLSAPMGPAFLQALGEEIGATPGAHDLELCAFGRNGEPAMDLEPLAEPPDHPRIQRSLQYRPDTRVYRTIDGSGLLAIGHGLAGRREAAFEVMPETRGRGLGRALARAALHLIEPGEPLFMQVAIGNVASLRAVLAAGLVPVGAEVLFT